MVASSALVLAPHYDDEVLACGGLVRQLGDSGAAVRVLFLSDGGANAKDDDRQGLVQRRRAEARQAAEVLGLVGVDELGLPDGQLEEHGRELEEGIRRALLAQRPQLILVPSPLEISRDHRAAFWALYRLLSSARGDSPLAGLIPTLRVLLCEINQPLVPDLLVDVSPQLETLERSMACYGSQQEQHDYLRARLGLLRFRTHTLPPGVEAAEAYRRLDGADLQTLGPGQLVAQLGGSFVLDPPEAADEAPLVSLVVRTRDRPQLLAQALASAARSTYARTEVLVVNDGGAVPQLPDSFPFKLRLFNLAGKGNRAAAANAGVEAAEGRYLAFLDDDDLVEPEHLSTLVGLVRAAGVRVAYTDAAVGVYRLAGEQGWQCVERRLPYSRDFDPDLLLFDNYIPFNTLLMERQLLREVGGFDTRLPFFEDWDLLIRLARRVPFHHLPQVTCEYRHFRGAGHHVLGDQPRQRADFLEVKGQVLAKHAKLQKPETVASVIDQLRAEQVSAGEEASAVRRELRTEQEHRQALEGRAASLEIRNRGLEIEAENLRRELDEHRVVVHRHGEEAARFTEQITRRDAELSTQYENAERQEQQLQATYAEIERLGDLIRNMESTRAWRLHRWLERRRR